MLLSFLFLFILCCSVFYSCLFYAVQFFYSCLFYVVQFFIPVYSMLFSFLFPFILCCSFFVFLFILCCSVFLFLFILCCSVFYSCLFYVVQTGITVNSCKWLKCDKLWNINNIIHKKLLYGGLKILNSSYCS